MEALDLKKTILLLSGGNDSLLCALGLKACGYSVDTPLLEIAIVMILLLQGKE